MPEEVTVQRAWFVGLLEQAERAENAENEENRMTAFASLLGYISSARGILNLSEETGTLNLRRGPRPGPEIIKGD